MPPALPPPPRVQAMVLCDKLYRDESTKKCIIAGTFTSIFAARYPAAHPGAWLYVNLVEFTRETVRLQMVDVAEQRRIFTSPDIPVQTRDRRAPVELAIQLPPLPIPHPGSFALELVRGADETILATWRFEAAVTPSAETPS